MERFLNDIVDQIVSIRLEKAGAHERLRVVDVVLFRLVQGNERQVRLNA